jgi:hypothetical protein
MDLPDEVLFLMFSSLDVWSFYRCRRVCPRWNKVFDDGDVISYLRSLHPERDTESYTEAQLITLCRFTIIGCTFSQDDKRTLYVDNGALGINACLYSPCKGTSRVNEFVRVKDKVCILTQNGSVYWVDIAAICPHYPSVDSPRTGVVMDVASTDTKLSVKMVRIFNANDDSHVYGVDSKGEMYYIGEGTDNIVNMLPGVAIAGVISGYTTASQRYTKMMLVDIDRNMCSAQGPS